MGLNHTHVWSPHEVSDLAWVRRPLGELDPARVQRLLGGLDRAESEKLRVFEVGIRNAEVDAAGDCC